MPGPEARAWAAGPRDEVSSGRGATGAGDAGRAAGRQDSGWARRLRPGPDPCRGGVPERRA